MNEIADEVSMRIVVLTGSLCAFTALYAFGCVFAIKQAFRGFDAE